MTGMLLPMIDDVLNLVAPLGSWSYLVVFLGVMLESAVLLGFIIPGETLVLFGGFLAAHGLLDWRALTICVCLGALLGDSIGYELGRRVGQGGLLRVGHWIRLRPAQLEKAQNLFLRHGGKAVFLGRFMAFMRTAIPFIAGSSGLRYRRFLAYNAAGDVLWGLSFVVIGYFSGAAWRVVGAAIGVASGSIGAVLILTVVVLWLRRSLGNRPTSRGTAMDASPNQGMITVQVTLPPVSDLGSG